MYRDHQGVSCLGIDYDRAEEQRVVIQTECLLSVRPLDDVMGNSNPVNHVGYRRFDVTIELQSAADALHVGQRGAAHTTQRP